MQESLPPKSIKAALKVLKTGRLHRYNTAKDEISPAALFEAELTDYIGSKFCLELSSCGSALYVALKSVGVKPGDQILYNTFTLAPVAGAIPVFIEIEEDYLIDLTLDKKLAKLKLNIRCCLIYVVILQTWIRLWIFAGNIILF